MSLKTPYDTDWLLHLILFEFEKLRESKSSAETLCA